MCRAQAEKVLQSKDKNGADSTVGLRFLRETTCHLGDIKDENLQGNPKNHWKKGPLWGSGKQTANNEARSKKHA